MGEIDLLGMVIAAVVLLLLGGNRRQVQREDLGVEILADRQG